MVFSLGRKGPVVSATEVNPTEARPQLSHSEQSPFGVGVADNDQAVMAASRVVDLLSRGEVSQTVVARVGLENAIRTCRRQASDGSIRNLLDNIVGFHIANGSTTDETTVEEVLEFAGLIATCMKLDLDPFTDSDINAGPREISGVVAPILDEAEVERVELHWAHVDQIAPAVSEQQWATYQAANPVTM